MLEDSSYPYPGSKNYWSDIEVTSTQYILNIAPMGFAAWVVSWFLSDRRQRVRLDGKVRASVDVASGATQSKVLRPLLFVLYTSELFRIIESHIVRYSDDTTIYAAYPRPLSYPQMMELLNQDSAAIYSWCLKWHMLLNY